MIRGGTVQLPGEGDFLEEENEWKKYSRMLVLSIEYLKRQNLPVKLDEEL